MRAAFVLMASSAALLACSPPSSEAPSSSASDAPTVVACNSVAPNLSRQVSVQDAAAAVAAVADLRGGAITPGTYDLVSATRVGAATGWSGARAVALDVAEAAEGGVTLNWAGAASAGEVDRWTATLTETPTPRLTYTCGRVGAVDADFAANASTLEMRLQDGAGGQLALNFQRRP